MNEKWALITGSSRGLGFHIALALANEGYNVIITGRDSRILDGAYSYIKKNSKIIPKAVCLDLTNEEGPQELFSILKKQDISLSVIINNLGGSVIGDKRNVPKEILRSSIRLNLEVGIEINNLFYNDLKQNKGVIVHVSSTAALHYDASPGYVISKAALNAYVKNASRCFGNEGVCIFALLPGILNHKNCYIQNLQTINPDKYKQLLSKQIFNEFIDSEKIANFLIQLLKTGLPMINGSLIQLDGGII